MRRAIVAGQFYAAGFQQLEEQIKNSFTDKLGPGALPIKKREKEIKGIIAPHAGYMFSGPCAAWAYKEITESKFPDLFILLGLDHGGFGLTCVTAQDFETPLGVVKTDKDFCKKLIDAGFDENDEAHAREHSIEVQIPFLQFASKGYLDKLRIVPIIIADSSYEKWARMIKDVLEKTKKQAIVIASSDFTHFGINYGYFPFKENIKENLYKLDKGAIEHIKNCDAYRFLDYCNETGATICGKFPIAVLLEIFKKQKADLLRYYTSGDVVDDYSGAVGYAAIVIS